MPGVLMLESLSQVAAMLLLQREDAPPNARVYLRGVNDAKFRRQVFPGDRLRLEVTLGPAAGVARARAGGGDRRRSGRGRSRAAARPRRRRDRRSTRRRSSIRARRSAAGTTVGPHAIDRAAGADRRELPHRRVGGDRRLDRARRRLRDLSVRVDRPDSAGPQVPRRGHAADDRPPQHLPRVRHRPPRHRGRRRRHADRRSQRVHGLRARRARLPRRRRHDLRQHGDARRPRHGRGLREHQRRIGRPSVLPRRPPRVHRRLLGRDEGRAAVCAHGRQPPGADLRRQHHRPGAARLHRPT